MNPLTLFICVVVSLIGAISLLIFAPGFLLVYGPVLAYGWMSVLVAWMVVEFLDELYEREQGEKESVPLIEGRIQLTGYEDFARAIDYACSRLRGELP